MSEVILTIESVRGQMIPPDKSGGLINIIHEQLEINLGYDVGIDVTYQTGETGFVIDKSTISDVMHTIVSGLEMNCTFRVYPPSHVPRDQQEAYLKDASKYAPSTGTKRGSATVTNSGLYEGNKKIWGGTDKDEALSIFQKMKKELEND